MTWEWIFSGGQAHGLRENNKHRTEPGVQVERKTQVSKKQGQDPQVLLSTIFSNPSVVINHLLQRRVEEGQEPVNLTGGPLAYKYQFQEMFFHWGEKVRMWHIIVIAFESSWIEWFQQGGDGSEHTVAHHAFPAELQVPLSATSWISYFFCCSCTNFFGNFERWGQYIHCTQISDNWV